MKRLVARLPHCLVRTRVLLGASLCLFIFSVGGCSEEPPPDPVFVPAQFAVTESADGFAVSGAEPGSELALFDANGDEVDRGTADESGALTFSAVPGGDGYVVAEVSGAERQQSEPISKSFPAAVFAVRESVRQLHVTDAQEGQALQLFDSDGQVVEEGSADALGSLVFREIPPGPDYTIRAFEGAVETSTDPLTVMSVENSQPDSSFYSDQVLEPGFNYITMRDGTTLSAYVFLPGPPEDGPYPTVVNYSGYEPSRPGEVFDESYVAFCGLLPVLCDAPGHPSGLIAGIFGFASVGVNMRGTGCSGGAYDFFEENQVLDGYDIIQTVSSQPWVKHGKVGMTGLSYPGISQLFVAQTQPPGLAAITPLSVIADTAASVLAPGGIFNDGFALQWAENVVDNAGPYGQGWSNAQIALEAESGVTTCDDNQKLHGQKVDAVSKALQYIYYEPSVADPLSPKLFASEIEVPVFTSGQWQDEQTGPHFATLLDKFTEVPALRAVVTNGLHADGYTPHVLAEWLAFLQIYVDRSVPFIDPLIALTSGELFEAFLGVNIPLPTLPFSDAAVPGIPYEEAKAGWEAQPQLRAIFENGLEPSLVDGGNAGAPSGAFSVEFDSYPPPETGVLRLYFNRDGTLRTTPPEESESASSFERDAEAASRTFSGSQPFYQWADTQADRAVVFVSDPLAEDTLMLGSGSVDLWVQTDSPSGEAELEVLLSEIRPDGQETYVQIGLLRATQRALAPDATELRPIKTHLEVDGSPLPAGQWEPVRVELMPFGHPFRKDSQIRLEVSTPGDSRELWAYILDEEPGPVRHRIAHDASHPSSVALPIITGDKGAIPTPLSPVCTPRAQPCRTNLPFVNTLSE